MKTAVMKMLGLEAPIFAFSHCRDVVAAVSRAGGMGVLGTTHVTPEQLDIELAWLDAHTEDRNYGVDLMFASNARQEFEGMTIADVDKYIPADHRKFVDDLMRKYGVPELPPGEREAIFDEYMRGMIRTHKSAEARLEVLFRHPKARVMASALGVPPAHVTTWRDATRSSPPATNAASRWSAWWGSRSTSGGIGTPGWTSSSQPGTRREGMSARSPAWS